MKVPLGIWVNLPRLGKDAFRELMRVGVEYTTGKGFFVRPDSDLTAIRIIVSEATGDEVEFVFRCYLCGRESVCVDCQYHSVCSIEQVGGNCLCARCASENMVGYRERWRASLS
jgi:hypothetical protein